MNDERIDHLIRAAFVARSQGSPSPDLTDRIRSAVADTRQEHPLIALPRSGRFIAVRQLALAAALGAAVLVVASSMLSGLGGPNGLGGDPSATPTERPSASPSEVPSGDPSQAPTPPPSLTPGTIFEPDSVVRIVSPGPLDLHAEADAESDAVGQVPPGTSAFVVAEPTTVGGETWYLIQPFDIAVVEPYPLGWVRVSDAIGGEVLEPTVLTCPSGVMAYDAVHALTMVGALACFGDEPIEIRGNVFCMPNDDLPEDLEHRVTGPFWLDDGRYCAFQDQSGEPAFEIIGFPTDELPPTWQTSELVLRGHFDDPESAACVSLEGTDERSRQAAVLTCRSMFHNDGQPTVVG